MKRRFVVITSQPSVQQQNLITLFFKNGGYGYWHWSYDTWLVTTMLQDDAAQLRDKLQALTPKLSMVVLYIEPQASKKWALLGPPTWGEWFRSTWE